MIHTPPRIPARNGFSLVEMLAVLMVMGLLAGVALLSIPGDEAAVRNEAERLAARTGAARDQAITASRPVAVVIDGSGYRFEDRTAGQWAAAAVPAPGAWQDGTHVAMETGQRRIVFDSLGLANSDAVIRLTHANARASVHIRRDGQVRVDAE